MNIFHRPVFRPVPRTLGNSHCVSNSHLTFSSVVLRCVENLNTLLENIDGCPGAYPDTSKTFHQPRRAYDKYRNKVNLTHMNCHFGGLLQHLLQVLKIN